MVFLRVLKLSGEHICSGDFEGAVATIWARAAAALGRCSFDLAAGTRKLKGDETVEALALQDGDSLVAIARRQLQLVAGTDAMAALKGDGSVLTWGHAAWGGDCTSVKAQLEGGVEQVVAGGRAMAAVKRDGSVLTWGRAHCGGDCATVKAQLADGIEQVVAPARRRIRGKRPLSL